MRILLVFPLNTPQLADLRLKLFAQRMKKKQVTAMSINPHKLLICIQQMKKYFPETPGILQLFTVNAFMNIIWCE
jgi:hypothetical protein